MQSYESATTPRLLILVHTFHCGYFVDVAKGLVPKLPQLSSAAKVFKNPQPHDFFSQMVAH
jgi:hypothetical protein